MYFYNIQFILLNYFKLKYLFLIIMFHMLTGLAVIYEFKKKNRSENTKFSLQVM